MPEENSLNFASGSITKYDHLMTLSPCSVIRKKTNISKKNFGGDSTSSHHVNQSTRLTLVTRTIPRQEHVMVSNFSCPTPHEPHYRCIHEAQTKPGTTATGRTCDAKQARGRIAGETSRTGEARRPRTSPEARGRVPRISPCPAKLGTRDPRRVREHRSRCEQKW